MKLYLFQKVFQFHFMQKEWVPHWIQLFLAKKIACTLALRIRNTKKGNSEEHQPSHCSLSFEILSYIKYLDLIVTEIRRCVFSNPCVCVLNGNISVVIAHLHIYSSSKIKYLIKFVSIALIEYNVVDGVALSVPQNQFFSISIILHIIWIVHDFTFLKIARDSYVLKFDFEVNCCFFFVRAKIMSRLHFDQCIDLSEYWFKNPFWK